MRQLCKSSQNTSLCQVLQLITTAASSFIISSADWLSLGGDLSKEVTGGRQYHKLTWMRFTMFEIITAALIIALLASPRCWMIHKKLPCNENYFLYLSFKSILSMSFARGNKLSNCSLINTLGHGHIFHAWRDYYLNKGLTLFSLHDPHINVNLFISRNRSNCRSWVRFPTVPNECRIWPS